MTDMNRPDSGPHHRYSPATMRRTLTAVLLLAAGAIAAGASPAAAAISSSQVTAPADGLRVTSTDATTAVAVAGTSAGGAVAEPLSLACYLRPGKATSVGTATVDDPAGAFTGNAFLAGLRGPCVLRALPGAFTSETGDPGPFLGPLVTVEAQRATTVAGGGNDGKTRDVSDWLQQSSAGVGLCSIGSFGLCGSRLFDAVARRNTEPVFNAGGWIGATTGTRSYLQVDGANAYPPARAAQITTEAPGLPSITRTTTRDAGGGTASVVESDPIARCNTDAFPPADACTAFLDTGVRYERTSTVSADGTVVEQRDTLASTDGKAHTVSAYLGQNFLVDATVSPALRFGWVAGDVAGPRATGTTVAGPASGPATVYVGANAAAPDGDPVYAQGAVTFDRPPASVRVNAPTDLLVRFGDVAVPAGGRAALVTSTYVIARTVAQVNAAALAREDALVPPTVSFSTPKAGAIVLTPKVTVTGTTADNRGVASLTVGGKPVTPRSDGRFSVALDVVKGANTITAVATDAAGNATQATLKLTYQDRLAPTVGSLSLNPRVWRVGRSTRVGFTLGEAGTMRLTANRPRAGRRNKAGTCVASTSLLRRAKARICLRYVVVATAVAPVQAGVVRAAIGPKLGNRFMQAGRLRLSVTVTDYARNVSKARTLDVLVRKPLRG
ncbi:MAG: repeat protein [Solirubrobacterales bacterium]|nr:repeat protein [Solirubrobacterales bacterium]